METWQIILTVISAVLASNGLWAYIMKRFDDDSAERKMLVGLAHDRIHYLGMKYIELKCITKEEYENLFDYLYTPYKDLGGNGSADRIMVEVAKLPICSTRSMKELKGD